MTILDKIKGKEPQPNRKDRRKSAGIFPRIGNLIKRKVQIEDRIKRRKATFARERNKAGNTITMRLLRDIERQTIARREGVNWKRVVLTNKVNPGATEFVIKKTACRA